MRRHAPAVAVLSGLALALALATPAFAVWPNQPSVNLKVCTAAAERREPGMIPDGAGGAILSWHEYRSASGWDICAQHILATGAVDPAWPANGRTLCAAAGDQYVSVLVSDGAGGAIVAWTDARSGPVDVYAHHVLASGAVDPAWPANGRAICTAAGNQSWTRLVPDGAGGAIVTWADDRTGENDIYAHRILASGALDPAWPVNGRALCTASNFQYGPTIATDGSGGAIVAWEDWRGGTARAYAQHVLVSGSVDPAWPFNGRDLSTDASYKFAPVIVSDGLGGALVAWGDARAGSYDVYVQRVLPSGITDPGWPGGGRPLCTDAADQIGLVMVPDGAGGAIVAWEDHRVFGWKDVYAHHVWASGVADPAWPVNGRALCTAAADQAPVVIAEDGLGGAFACWVDSRNSNWDLYAQHVSASGVLDGSWPTNGLAVCTGSGSQMNPTVISDGAGGAIFAWQDARLGAWDLYAQRVGRHGYLGTPEPQIMSVRDVPFDQGGHVKVSWNASWPDPLSDPNFSGYDVLRSVPPGLAMARLANGAQACSAPDETLRSGPDRMLVTSAEGTNYYWEYLATVTALHYVSGYSILAPTAQDSTAPSPPRTAFLVVARNGSGSMFWPSRADSGYSVDDLGPAVPAPFTGTYAAGTTRLHWNPNAEPDLAGYRLYRGTSAGFVPSAGNLVAALPDTGHVDAGGAPFFYKLTAVDVHGNESPAALLSPGATADADGPAPVRTFLALAGPNPSRGATALRFGLAATGRASLALYDAGGRRVRTLVAGELPPGVHAASWDGRDDAGHVVAAGFYFARFEAAGFEHTVRLVRAE